ncbi:MAG: hypothetical protein K2X32_02975 [Phycisphaerales bacterium]|nr:hypothetical protein [Phycisphaerales bacterium]
MSDQVEFFNRVFTSGTLVDIDMSRLDQWIDLVYYSDLDAEMSGESGYWRFRFKQVTKFDFTLESPASDDPTITRVPIIRSSDYRLIRSSNSSFEIVIKLRGAIGEGSLHIACRSMQTMPADHGAYSAIGKAWFERTTPHVLARFSADALADLVRSTRPRTRE